MDKPVEKYVDNLWITFKIVTTYLPVPRLYRANNLNMKKVIFENYFYQQAMYKRSLQKSSLRAKRSVAKQSRPYGSARLPRRFAPRNDKKGVLQTLNFYSPFLMKVCNLLNFLFLGR